jgi:hypothetical protein
MAPPDDPSCEDSASAPASSDAVIAALQAEIVQLRAENAALLGSEGPSVRKRTVRNENTDGIPRISIVRRRFCSSTGANCRFAACNHDMQSGLHAASVIEAAYCTQ